MSKQTMWITWQMLPATHDLNKVIDMMSGQFWTTLLNNYKQSNN